MIVLVDNYDSFTFNLAQYLTEYTEVTVIRNDEPTLLERASSADGIVLSPGPGHPREANLLEEVIRTYQDSKPMLGICLGHQAIGEVNGAVIKQAVQIKHGKTSLIEHQGTQLFKAIPRQTTVMRYHSLTVDQKNLPPELEILARSLDDKEIMAMKLTGRPVYGLQFHPESIGSLAGKKMIENFVEIVKNEVDKDETTPAKSI